MVTDISSLEFDLSWEPTESASIIYYLFSHNNVIYILFMCVSSCHKDKR